MIIAKSKYAFALVTNKLFDKACNAMYVKKGITEWNLDRDNYFELVLI